MAAERENLSAIVRGGENTGPYQDGSGAERSWYDLNKREMHFCGDTSALSSTYMREAVRKGFLHGLFGRGDSGMR
jgi:hypothetical protein